MTSVPKSLYRSCLEFIGFHTHLIDSLVGLPEIVGKDIFNSAFNTYWATVSAESFIKGNLGQPIVEENRFMIAGKLKVFFDAYGDGDILISLSLKESHLLFSDVIDDCWWLLQNLNHLDLSLCGLGDSHDALPSLVGTLRLETLILRNNCLTDEGIRKLTAQARYKMKVSLLRFLDLSDNENITNISLKFLKCLQNLSLLSASNTSISSEGCGIPCTWQAFKGQEVCQCIFSSFVVTTAGWAAHVIERWKLDYVISRVPSSSRLPTTDLSAVKSSSAQNFYSRKRSIAENIKQCEKPVPSHPKKILIFATELFACPHFKPANKESSYSIQGERFSHPVPQSIHLSSSSSKNLKCATKNEKPNQENTMLTSSIKPLDKYNFLSHNALSGSGLRKSNVNQNEKCSDSTTSIGKNSWHSEPENVAEKLCNKTKSTVALGDTSFGYCTTQNSLVYDSTLKICRNDSVQYSDKNSCRLSKYSRQQILAAGQNNILGSKEPVSDFIYCTSASLASSEKSKRTYTESITENNTLDCDALLSQYRNSPVSKKHKKLSVLQLQLLEEYL